MTEAQPQTPPREHWYYVEGEKHFGPVTKEFIEASITNGTIPKGALVWREGLSTWIKAEGCPFLTLEQPQRPTAPPPVVSMDEGKSSAPTTAIPSDAQVQYAGLHWRLLAGIIDTLVMALPALLVAAMAEAVFGPNDAVGWLFIIMLWWVYYAALHASRWQASIGMKLLKLKITGRTGERIDFGRATGRYFASLISSAFCYTGFLIIPFTPKRQGFHDLVCGTFVIRNK